jgi:hypothetical protein
MQYDMNYARIAVFVELRSALLSVLIYHGTAYSRYLGNKIWYEWNANAQW